MQSTVLLFNTALGRLGGEQIPLNISPQEWDADGQLCANLFPHVLDLTLSAHDWSFAIRRVALGPVKVKKAAACDSYRFAYGMPSDCLKPIRLEGHAGVNRTPPYVIEGETLLTDQEQAVLVYVARVTDPKLWPASFADALIWGLAGELASARINDAQKQSWCYQNHKIALADAIARDCSGQNPEPPRSAWKAARFGRW
jgi:hypothetical protein